MDEPGFGQSILHKGQLVFHTPPYDSCQLTVQESYYYWDNTSRSKSRASYKVPKTDVSDSLNVQTEMTSWCTLLTYYMHSTKIIIQLKNGCIYKQ